MEILELMEQRHAVRQYLDKAIESEKRQVLDELAQKINKEYKTNIQICYDEPNAFNTFMAHYGKFENCKNYIALVCNDAEKAGYTGEMLVLKAQELGLNTCWVAMTYGKGKVKINKQKGEKIQCVIALGYGKTQGTSHKTKSVEDVLELIGEKPEKLDMVIKACLLAPTAMNQQKFKIVCDNGKISIKKSGIGFYTAVDLGIVKLHKDVVLNKNNQII